jgi:cell division septation protein DedD
VALYASSILLAGGLFYATSDTPLSGSFRSSLNPFDLFFNNLDEQKTKEVKISAAQQPVYQAPAKVEPTVSVAQPELVETKTSVVIENSTSIAKETINEKPPIEIPKTIQIATAQTEKKAIESDENAQYFVIAGAFLKEDNAINLVSKLKKSGYPNASMMAIDDRNLFKVSAVGLSSEARAVGQMAKINKLSKAQSWVLHVD